MAPRVRLAVQTDVNAIVALSTKVQNHITASGSKQVIGPLVKEDVMEAVLDQRCYLLVLNNDGSSCDEFVPGFASTKHEIDVDNFPCGNHASIRQSTSITERPKPWSFIHSLMIDPEYQNKGHGTLLVQGVLAGLFQKGVQTVFLDCWDGAVRLRHFYEHLGFTLVGLIPEDDYHVALYGHMNGLQASLPS